MQVRTNYGDYEQDKVLRSIAKLHTIGRQTACHHEILSNYAKRSDKLVMQTSLRFLDEPCMIHILRSDLKNINVNISIDKYEKISRTLIPISYSICSCCPLVYQGGGPSFALSRVPHVPSMLAMDVLRASGALKT